MGFELERVIDDFIFLCFFVGNDFLPHLPSLEIRQGAIDTLADLYKTSFKQLGGYICDGGEVNIARAKQFCTDLGQLEDELLARRKVQEDRDRQREQRKKRDVQVSGHPSPTPSPHPHPHPHPNPNPNPTCRTAPPRAGTRTCCAAWLRPRSYP